MSMVRLRMKLLLQVNRVFYMNPPPQQCVAPPPLHNISDGFPIALRAALQSPPAMRDAYKLAGALCPFRFRFRCPVWTWIPFPIRVRIRNSVDENETENCTGKPDRREGPVVVTFCFWVFPAPLRPIFAKSIRLNARLRCSLVIYYVTRTLHWSARDGHWVPWSTLRYLWGANFIKRLLTREQEVTKCEIMKIKFISDM